MAQTPQSVSGFTVLPLHIPPVPSFPHETTHYLYIRPHQPKLPDPISPRSLYLANIPIDSTPSHFRALFSTHLGGHRLDHVTFDAARPSKKAAQRSAAPPKKGKKRKRAAHNADEPPDLNLPPTWDRAVHPSGSAAVCVFADEQSARSAMKRVVRAVSDGEKITWGVDARGPALGAARYAKHEALRFPAPEALQDAADTFMTAFGEYEAGQARKRVRQRAEPDEEGFVTVTRGGREAPARAQEASEKLKRQREREREKTDGMADFYRFQNRERKKEAERELLRKFEEDRRKVEEMRKARGRKAAFTPMG